MTFFEQKIKHLEMIQDVIKRMASNSFQLKAWTVTIVSAILALTGKEGQGYLLPISLIPVLLFWGLDAYFLWQERLYRRLYNQVRLQKDDTPIDFSLNCVPLIPDEQTWFRVGFSRTLVVFYGLLLLIMAALMVALVLPV